MFVSWVLSLQLKAYNEMHRYKVWGSDLVFMSTVSVPTSYVPILVTWADMFN